MNIRLYQDNDFEEIINLVAKFRIALAKLKDRDKEKDLLSAQKELNNYI